MRRTLLALTLCLTAATTWAQGGPPPARVQLDAVRSESLEQWREVTGELRALQRSTLAAEVEGRVVEVPVREGDHVEAGQVVARLDDRLLGLDVRSARADAAAKEAALADAEAIHEKAARDLPRAERLFADGRAVSEQVVDDARTDLVRAEAAIARARAELQQARAGLARAQERLADAQVRAPFAGAVLTRHVEAGAWLRTGDPVVTLSSDDRLEAWLAVPERYLARLQSLRGPLQVRIPALGRVLEAPMTAILPEADELARTFAVRAVLTDSEGLAPGLSAAGLVPTGRRGDSLTVSRDAILRDDAGEFVYFDGGGRAVVARVQTLFAAGGRVAVESSQLQPGMQVVTEGHQRLFPGQPLQPLGGGS